MNVLGRIPLKIIHKSGASEENPTSVVILFCVDGQVNDIQVRFLIDSAPSVCFISQKVVEDSDLIWSKSQEQLKVYFSRRLCEVLNQCLRQAHVNFGEHAKFLDFLVIS